MHTDKTYPTKALLVARISSEKKAIEDDYYYYYYSLIISFLTSTTGCWKTMASSNVSLSSFKSHFLGRNHFSDRAFKPNLPIHNRRKTRLLEPDHSWFIFSTIFHYFQCLKNISKTLREVGYLSVMLSKAICTCCVG